MIVNKQLLMLALNLAAAHAAKPVAHEVPAPNEPPTDHMPPNANNLKGTPPNPARMTKAQRKANKRERRTNEDRRDG